MWGETQSSQSALRNCQKTKGVNGCWPLPAPVYTANCSDINEWIMLKWCNMGNIYQLFHAIALRTSVFGAARWSQWLPVPVPVCRWEVLARAPCRWCSFTSPARIPPFHQSLWKGTDPKTFSTSGVVLDWGLPLGNHNQFVGFASGLGEFWNDLWRSTRHRIFHSPNWDVFTTFHIKPKLDYLGLEPETFSRRLEKMSLKNYENQKMQW